MKLFDAHCHLQDPRIFDKAPQLIAAAVDSGVVRFACNGVSEVCCREDTQLAQHFKTILRGYSLCCSWRGNSQIWERLRDGWELDFMSFSLIRKDWSSSKIGLDKGSQGKKVDFTDQVNVFRQQLELAKELKRPASIHCVRAFGDLLQIMKSLGPFPAGVILHSYLGSAEMVPEFANLGAYFSFSGFLMSMKVHKAKRMLKMVPSERILLETDAPDALPKSELDSAHLVEGASLPEELQSIEISSAPFAGARDVLTFPKEALNHPQNIHKG
ncbi:uncharacterized protein LOC110760737 isoform X6 [Prunus avium]|uniref:Uncharacterized protein LOC110760737 isoform X6 n=1 Tax=Prunus avium TaxID=42229 RepID=A0A6P5SRF5_PRUAV|nr:uncharacterized protein LOC110760737 isoform X6 [Prunus avium]